MLELISQFAELDRVPVGPGTRKLTEALASRLGAAIREVPSGTRCLDWDIPDGWFVNTGTLTAPDGELIADYARHPLYLRSFCSSFQGEVELETLRQHLLHDPDCPDHIPFDYRCWYDAQQRHDWGFALPDTVASTLQEGRYAVDIDVEHRPDAMCYIDHVLPGSSSDTILLAAHTCHPAQVNDGIANVAVLVELFEWLAGQDRQLSYRLVLGPEYYTAAAVLAEGSGLDDLLGGIYLDLSGADTRLAWSRSSSGQSWIDHLLATTCSGGRWDVAESGYRGVIGNDEMFYDGPGFQIPVIPVCRTVPGEYHTSGDDLGHCHQERLEEMQGFLRHFVELAESEDRPRSAVVGPPCLSRRGLAPLPASSRWGTQATQMVLMRLDGHHSTAQIACEGDVPLADIEAFIENLRRSGAIEPSAAPRVLTAGDK